MKQWFHEIELMSMKKGNEILGLCAPLGWTKANL